MAVEIEAKFKLKCSIEEVLSKLVVFRPVLVERYTETDTYYSHPCRDFRASDEALRVRVKCSGNSREQLLSYKGRRVSRGFTKRRLEIEVPISDLQAFKDLLSSLGFREVTSFSKQRTVYSAGSCELYFDELIGVGTFIEIEGSQGEIAQIANLIWDCVEHVDKTYLEICLETNSCKPASCI